MAPTFHRSRELLFARGPLAAIETVCVIHRHFIRVYYNFPQIGVRFQNLAAVILRVFFLSLCGRQRSKLSVHCANHLASISSCVKEGFPSVKQLPIPRQLYRPYQAFMAKEEANKGMNWVWQGRVHLCKSKNWA